MQSDGSVVSTKSANKDAPEASAEWTEKRDPAERNTDQANPPQAQNRDKVGKSGLERVREAARKDGKLKFVSLLHHADVEALRRSFYQLKKTAAVGIDGITWQEYEHDLNGVSESAGINRLETENERVLQRKLSQSLWPRTLRWEQ